MKKFFSLMAAALMSVAMMAGENDLLWDFSEGAPSTNPVAANNNANVNLYYGSKVTDGPGVKNGLYGIKMNGSGYAYFTKAAVAGKLKLGFGPRSGSNAESMTIKTWAGDPASATVPTSLSTIATTGAQTEYGFQVIDLTAEQNNIYIARTGTTESVLQYLQFTENVDRTFVDFEMIMCNMASEYDFTTLPEGVTASGSFNNDQHGYRGFTISVPVDGPVKFTIGDCSYGNQPIAVKNSQNATVATLTYPAEGCYKNDEQNQNKVFTYTYTGGADVLTFGPIQYCNYFKAEAVDVTPCEIIFKDQNGAELGRVETIEGAFLETIPYTVENLPAIGEGNAFRGWFYTSGKKAKVGDPINGNTTIQAKVTPIEEVTIGSVQTYDLASPIFYPEDHETVEVSGGSYYNNHGWYFNADGSINVQVAGNAVVVVTLCQFSESGDVMVKNGENVLGSFSVVKNETPDGAEMTAQYAGEATTLTISWTAKQYIHKVVVYNVEGFVEKDENTGYIMVPAGDAASFILALVQAQEGDKIFLPNGVYDLGETVLTTISKNNISIIGQSMDGVIIKNAPDYKTESIDKTATIKINKNVVGTYLQDLTIQNALDYYKNNNGRAVCLWDQGKQTICKNVKLLSYQDTYYSNLVGGTKYFEDCEIHGTVDFICGDGSVYFKNTELVCEQRSTEGGGSDALTASNADASDKGYVFESCSVRYADNIQGPKPVVSLGRSWNNKPKTIFLNTVLADDLNMVKDASAQKDKIQRWTLGGMNILPEKFGEYNSVNAAGQVVSPASNNVTFVLGSAEKQMETILTAEEAATYTMEYTLGEWAATATAEAEQKRMNVMINQEETVLSWNATEEGVYMVCLSDVPFITTETSLDLTAVNWGEVYAKFHEMYGADIEVTGGYYVRFANGRGGFGPKVWPGETPEGIENTEVSNNGKVSKIFRDGHLIILKNNNEYSVLGGLVK